ncbi:T9SS type A sorting domain-containing protein [Algibacter mikhailovii]|uniref:T9SS type A sorting domain-containing protein n=1 Tax=Algibacter mikhailovii TaxID=425498 RepID=UPI002494FDDF|nr:T9SS type A sorting domain-containing protein [Algibacter mikhailovii]
MRTKLHSKSFKQKNTYFAFALCLVSLFTFAQDPVDTSNTEITGATVTFAFDEENNPPDKVNLKEGILDDNVDTDWAGNLNNSFGEASIIIDLGGTYDLAEIQYLTVAKDDPYAFQLLVSTNGADYTDVYGGDLQQSNIDATYKQFVLPSTQTGATHVKLICFGRIDATTEANRSAWNTISELKLYAESTASLKDNELSGFTLSPNPANSFFTLSNLNNKVNNVQILSLEGKLISSQSFDGFSKKLTIDTANLANGVYVVKLSDAAKSLNASKLMVIQH